MTAIRGDEDLGVVVPRYADQRSAAQLPVVEHTRLMDEKLAHVPEVVRRDLPILVQLRHEAIALVVLLRLRAGDEVQVLIPRPALGPEVPHVRVGPDVVRAALEGIDKASK